MSIDIINSSSNALTQLTYASSVASENINNASDKDYSRQVVSFKTNQLGILEASSTTMSNAFLNQQVYDSNSEVAFYNALTSIANSVDNLTTNVTTSSDGGSTNPIEQAINDISEALTTATSDDSTSSRSDVLAQLSNLTTTTNTIISELNTYKSQALSEAKQAAQDLSEVTTQIAKLNKKITSTSNTAELISQRNSLISKASELVDLNVTENENGTVDISVYGGSSLVKGEKSYNLEISKDKFGDPIVKLNDKELNVSNEKLGGKLGGNLEAIESLVEPAKAALAELITGIAISLNTVNEAGYTDNGVTNVNLFTLTSSTAISATSNSGNASLTVVATDNNELTDSSIVVTYTAAGYEFKNVKTGDIEVASTLPSNVFGLEISQTSGTIVVGDQFKINSLEVIAASITVTDDIKNIAVASSSGAAAGDNANLIALAEMMEQGIFDSGKETATTKLSNVFSSIGNATLAAKNSLSTASTIQGTAIANWENYSGVSTQEEELNLMQYQQVYEAISKVLSVNNEMFDTILKII